MTAFSTYARDVLDLRQREGVRGIVSERNRFDLHISNTPTLEKTRSTRLRERRAACS